MVKKYDVPFETLRRWADLIELMFPYLEKPMFYNVKEALKICREKHHSFKIDKDILYSLFGKNAEQDEHCLSVWEKFQDLKDNVAERRGVHSVEIICSRIKKGNLLRHACDNIDSYTGNNIDDKIVSKGRKTVKLHNILSYITKYKQAEIIYNESLEVAYQVQEAIHCERDLRLYQDLLADKINPRLSSALVSQSVNMRKHLYGTLSRLYPKKYDQEVRRVNALREDVDTKDVKIIVDSDEAKLIGK